MLFNSLSFLIFFPIVVIGYFVLPIKLKNFWLLVASYYFYMSWSRKYALLILFSTIITYFCGILLETLKEKINDINKQFLYKKLTLVFCLVINLGILFVFKYTNFFMDTFGNILSIFHINFPHYEFRFALPVGISFYTFQAIGYTIDVYRGDIYAEKNFFKYALFVSFFPQLVAGPIERSKNLLKQLTLPHKFHYDNFRNGALLMLWGFFLKLVIADRASIYVDTIFNNIDAYTGFYMIIAAILFSLQIYCDFYGYSIIALGSAKIMGIDLMENFNAPFLSHSMRDHWRRWHISLTSWFTDYLYIPMGGNRKGTIRTYFNRFFTFSISGLWHGANLTYIIWGMLNGFYLIMESVLQPIRKRIASLLHINANSLFVKLSSTLFTFSLTSIAFVFFRATSLIDAFIFLKNMIKCDNLEILSNGSIYSCGLDQKNFFILIFAIFLLLFSDFCKRKKICIRSVILSQHMVFKIFIISIFIIFILVFGNYGPAYDSANFIYFQF